VKIAAKTWFCNRNIDSQKAANYFLIPILLQASFDMLTARCRCMYRQGKDCSAIARCCFGMTLAHMKYTTLPRCRCMYQQHTRRTPTVLPILGTSQESMACMQSDERCFGMNRAHMKYTTLPRCRCRYRLNKMSTSTVRCRCMCRQGKDCSSTAHCCFGMNRAHILVVVEVVVE
jgi:hypothetical protein